MKTQIFAMVIAIAALTSCSKNNGTVSGSAAQAAAVASTSGDWRVTAFSEGGIDETSDFAGYAFSFSTNGTLTATKNGVAKTGTWSVNNSSNKLIIDLGPKGSGNKPLGELTDDWRVISYTQTEIKLTDDNTSSNEFVTFTKN